MSVQPQPEPHIATVEEPFPAFYGTDVTTIHESFKSFLQRCPPQFCDLKDGRKLCYFTDGDKKDGVPVLAFHGGCEGKYKFAQKTPIPGMFLVAIDRPYYGGSSPINNKTYTFDDAAKDIQALADHLEIKEFIVTGHSVGTCWSLQLAASPLLAPRIKGVILWSTMIDPQHELTKGKFKEGQQIQPLCFDPVTGCCGCILDSAFGSLRPKFERYDFKDMMVQAGDFKTTKFNDFKQDPFWVASVMYSARSFYDPKSIAGDAHRTLISKWHYDCANITCPIYLFHGDQDHDMLTRPVSVEWVTTVASKAASQTELIKDCAHTLSLGPNDETRARFTKAITWIQQQKTGGDQNLISAPSPPAKSSE